MARTRPSPITSLRLMPAALLTACALLLSGCGQRGDLYMPEPTPPEQTQAQDQQAQTEAQSPQQNQ